jgi:membrane-bound serine protease (ClpP class)
MNRKLSYLGLIFLGILLLSFPYFSTAQEKTPERQVDVIKVNDIISPAIAEFITRSIEEAARNKAQCLVIQMDTPGGLDLSMRDIIKDMMSSDIPVVVYVAPSGARAASAGALITVAADIAAMAPGTNIGAAHPVAMGGGQMSRTMTEKVLNDAVAYVTSIAEKKKRNVQVAVRFVKESVSIPANEALKLKVIDLIASDLNDLLQKIDGKTIEKPLGTIKLSTKGANVNFIEMGFRQRFLSALSNPNLAYILMMIGLVGLYFELAHPGVIFPGVIGGICLILAFFAFRTLPVNYAGILLILLGVFLFIAEIKIASYGLLTVGGVVSLALGSIMLFESPAPFLRASLSVIIPTVAVTAAFFIFAMTMAIKAQMAKPATGSEGIVDETGIARTRIDPEGKVFVHGEFWNAYSEKIIEEGERIRVLKTEGLRLKVEKLG